MEKTPSFEAIAIRMKRLKVDRAWLSKQTHYSISSIANALAPKGNANSKTDSALARMWEALDREEERQKAVELAPLIIGPRLLIEPTQEQFDRWIDVATSKPGRTFQQWAKEGLDAKADAELPALLAARRNKPLGELDPPLLKVADESTGYSVADEATA